MTIIKKFEQKCAVCGKTSMQPVMMSTSTFDYPDLDFRPSEMERSTMFAWLDECPHCGYVAPKLENELEADSDILKTDSYLSCDCYDFKSELAKRFYRHYLISNAEKDWVAEFHSLLHCAWVCDDNEDELAFDMRKMALNSIDRIGWQSDEEENYLKIVKADLLRRTGQFDALISEFKDEIFKKEIENDVISFQIELAMKKDIKCHWVREVLERKTEKKHYL